MSSENRPIPEKIKNGLRAMMLEQMKSVPTLDYFELELFDWYAKETETLLADMLSSERAFLQEQATSEVMDANDSGMVAVEYHLRRVRYSHVIYMTSLLETFLERACTRLIAALGEQNIKFSGKTRKGDKFSPKRKFLEKYGHFEIPASEWKRLRTLITLRNNLVHDNGSTSDLKPNEKAALSNSLGIDIGGYDVLIQEQYVSHTFEALKSVVNFIECRLSEAIDQAARSVSVK